MQGLIKVGKTTKLPNERMKELHSTGVPTPFVLECAFEVDNCSIREKKAHAVLAKYRLERREFFQISVEVALRKILPVLGDYSVYQAKNSYDIPGLAEKLRQQEAKRRYKAEQQREEREKIAFENKRRQSINTQIELQLSAEEAQVHAWYRREFSKRFPERHFLLFATPLALAVFMLLPKFMPKLGNSGLFLVTLLVSWIGGSLLKNWRAEQRLQSPENQALEDELKNKLRAVREIVRRCSNCGQLLRFERAKLLEPDTRYDWNCPKCKSPILPS